jgi:hypothetical protein
MSREDVVDKKGRMNTAMNIAATGLRTTSTKFAADAAKVVRDTTTAATSTNLAADMVGVTTDAIAFRANLAVFKMADKSMGILFEVIA